MKAYKAEKQEKPLNVQIGQDRTERSYNVMSLNDHSSSVSIQSSRNVGKIQNKIKVHKINLKERNGKSLDYN